MIDTEELPDLDDLKACAQFKKEHVDEISELISWNMTFSKRAKPELQAGKIIPGIKLSTQGYEYPPEIADTLPDFGVNHFQFDLSPDISADLIFELLVEAMPNLKDALLASWKVETITDVKKCTEWLKDPDNDEGEISLTIRRLRKPKQSVTVK